jgi:hypothetical protein
VGKTAARHTSADFIDFLGDLLGTAKWASEIHIVLDNLSAHKTKAVEESLEANPKVRFHFTPTYSFWLKQVEIGFPKLSAMSLRGASSHPSPTWRANSANTFVHTASRPNRSAGTILMPVGESDHWLRNDRDSPPVSSKAIRSDVIQILRVKVGVNYAVEKGLSSYSP